MLKIRKATSVDINTIVEGNQRIACETEDRLLEKNNLVEGVSNLLNERRHGQYWICETENGEICGQIMITYEWSDWRNGQIWWLQSIYVWPDFRRQGVFQNLLEHIENVAKQQGVVLLRLYAEAGNLVAHNTYKKVGFETGTYQVFSKPIKSSV